MGEDSHHMGIIDIMARISQDTDVIIVERQQHASEGKVYMSTTRNANEVTQNIIDKGDGLFYTQDLRLASWLLTQGFKLDRVEFMRNDWLVVAYFVDNGVIKNSVNVWMFGNPHCNGKNLLHSYRKFMNIKHEFLSGTNKSDIYRD